MSLKKAKGSGKKVRNQKTKEEEQYLSRDEMLEMENLILQEKLLSKEAELIQAGLKEKLLEIDKLKLECRLIGVDSTAKTSKISLVKTKRTNLLQLIIKKYNIEVPEGQSFGYDPDTGKIIKE